MSMSSKSDLKSDCCNREVYERGEIIVVTGEATKYEVESICAAIRPYLREGVTLDWHYAGGRAVWKILDES